LDTAGEKEKRTSKKNVDGRSTNSHDNKKFRIRAMEKQGGMAFVFRKTATVVKKKKKPDRQIDLR
jgi:Tfp pilus assembly pilus retraction ATPase PilT